MQQPRPRLDAWPLLPRPAPDGGHRPEDEPVRAALTALAVLAGLFLALRTLFPETGLAAELAYLVALLGCQGGFALTLMLVALMVGVAVATPMLRLPYAMRHAALNAFDHAVHLALVVTVAGVLGVIVLHGRVTEPAVTFTLQALLLWGCHRTRLWLARRSAA